MLNIILIVVLACVAMLAVLQYNMRRMQIQMPKQEITIRMNKQLKDQFQQLNCSVEEKQVLLKYKRWLKNNSHKLQDRAHVDNYRVLYGEAPMISVKELSKYSVLPAPQKLFP